jgi:endonuclease YncB( thermonuclease family)
MARRTSTVVPFRRPRNPGSRHSPWAKASANGVAARPWWKQVTPVMIVLPVAAFALVLMWPAAAPAVPEATAAVSADTESASFPLCGGGARVDCVVDGDTFWYRGEKIRVADINTPETGAPQCPREAALGARATGRLQALLNAGPFTLEPVADGSGRDRDQYGRLLRTVTRGGESLGLVLVREGLAETWRGSRSSWC